MRLLVARKVQVARALRHRSFTLLWTGQTVSALGDAVCLVTLLWQALALTHSASAVGMVTTMQTVPQLLLLLPGGVMADRFPRRSILLLSDAARGGVVFTVTVLSWLHLLRYWHLVGLACCFGVAKSFFLPAYRPLLPQVLGGKDLPSANALTSASQYSTMLLGPPLAVLFSALHGASLAFGFDAATFFFSCGCLLLLPAVTPPVGLADLERAAGLVSPLLQVAGEIVGGLQYVRKTLWLWVSILIALVANAGIMGVLEVAMPRLIQQAGGTIALLGTAQATMALGAGGAAVGLGPLAPRPHRGVWLYLALALASVSLLLPLLPHGSFPLLAVILLISCLGLGAGLGGFTVIWEVLLQEKVPGHLLGRVSALDQLGSFALTPVGYVLAGVLSDARGPASVFLVAGLVTMAATLCALALPGIRHLDEPDAPAQGERKA